MAKISASQEDYIKLIWHLAQKERKATVQTIATMYGVSAPTVSVMLRQLARMDIVEYDKRSGARLTQKGDRLARKLIRKHRLVESFLQQVLQLDDLTVHEEAEKLEHAVSDRLMHNIADFLGYPTTDPHGSVIPEWDAEWKIVPLEQVATGESFRVQAVELSDTTIRYLNERNFKPGAVWSLEDQEPGGTSFLVTDGKRFLALSGEHARNIRVLVDNT